MKIGRDKYLRKLQGFFLLFISEVNDNSLNGFPFLDRSIYYKARLRIKKLMLILF